MLKFTNHNKDFFVQEMNLLSAILGEPAINESRQFAAVSYDPANDFITAIIQKKLKVFIF